MQYVHWLVDFVTLDLGQSVLNQVSSTDEFMHRSPASFELMALTLFWTAALGIPFGLVSAVRRNRRADYLVRLFAILAVAIPSFWIATLVLMLPAQRWVYAPPLDETVGLFEHPEDNIR